MFLMPNYMNKTFQYYHAVDLIYGVFFVVVFVSYKPQNF